MAITTPDELHEHIHLAIHVELSTIPLYLYAMYSIEDQTAEAPRLIRSVVAEEMLHAALAANLLLAVGGSPGFGSTELMPSYPSLLPHHTPPLELRLEKASPRLIEEVFLTIEQPETHEEIPHGDDFTTLGQFYHALEVGLIELSSRHDLFADPQLDAQMGDPAFYAPVEFDEEDSGGLMAITDLESAREAIHVIVHQGEGVSDEKWADPAHKELTHYHKFLRLAEGKADLGTVRPVPTNPRRADLPVELHPVVDVFNATYRAAYLTMDEIFSPGTEKGPLVGRLYSLMSDVMGPLGRHLMSLPTGDGVAAPTFEAYEFVSDDHLGELAALAEAVAAEHAELAPVAEVIAGL